jgi:predicted double-glycine peptidase
MKQLKTTAPLVLVMTMCTIQLPAVGSEAERVEPAKDSGQTANRTNGLNQKVTEVKGVPMELPAVLIRVPLTRQSTDYTCGVAALQSVMGYYGDEIREDTLAKALGADRKDGTRYRKIVLFAKKKGYTVVSEHNMTVDQLQKAIDQGRPVVVLIQAWRDGKREYKHDWDDGHYVVAVGYDRQNFFFMDPSTLGNYAYIPIGEFLDRWHDTDGKEKLVHFGMSISKKAAKFNAQEVKRLE